MIFKGGKVCNIYPEMRLVALLIISVALISLAACSVGPDYVRPESDIPGAYKEVEGWEKAQPGDDMIKGKWWEVFNAPELNLLEEKVDISNQNVAGAEAQFRQALAAVRVVRSGYFPTVTADASFSRSRRPTSAVAASTAGNIVSDYQLNGGVVWEADLWGKVRRMVEAGEAGAQADAADLEAVRLSVKATLAQNYFQLCALDSQKGLLDETVIAYQKALELTKNRYASGIASRGDVLQAETQLKTAQAEAIDIGIQRSQIEHAIALLIGKPASTFSSPVSPLSITPPGIPAGVPSQLLERRPDIAAAERRVASANAQIGVAMAAYYPALTLTASGGFQGAHLADWLSWPNRFWSVGSVVAETVFDAGLRSALTDEARAVYDATVASYRQTVLTGFQEVEDNLAAIRLLEDESRVLEDSVRVAEQATTVITNQYRAGTASYLNVIAAQTAELSARRAAIGTRGRRMTASVLLIKALGGGWHSPSTD